MEQTNQLTTNHDRETMSYASADRLEFYGVDAERYVPLESMNIYDATSTFMGALFKYYEKVSDMEQYDLAVQYAKTRFPDFPEDAEIEDRIHFNQQKMATMKDTVEEQLNKMVDITCSSLVEFYMIKCPSDSEDAAYAAQFRAAITKAVKPMERHFQRTMQDKTKNALPCYQWDTQDFHNVHSAIKEQKAAAFPDIKSVVNFIKVKTHANGLN